MLERTRRAARRTGWGEMGWIWGAVLESRVGGEETLGGHNGAMGGSKGEMGAGEKVGEGCMGVCMVRPGCTEGLQGL